MSKNQGNVAIVSIAPLAANSSTKPVSGSFSSFCNKDGFDLNHEFDVLEYRDWCDGGTVNRVQTSESWDVTLTNAAFFAGDAAYNTLQTAHFTKQRVWVEIRPTGTGSGRPQFDGIATMPVFAFSSPNDGVQEGNINLVSEGALTPTNQA